MDRPFRLIPGTGQILAIGATSVASTAFGSQTYAIMVAALGNCHIATGTTPVAVATDYLVKSSDQPLILAVSPGDKIAVIQDASATGNFSVVELTH